MYKVLHWENGCPQNMAVWCSDFHQTPYCQPHMGWIQCPLVHPAEQIIAEIRFCPIYTNTTAKDKKQITVPPKWDSQTIHFAPVTISKLWMDLTTKGEIVRQNKIKVEKLNTLQQIVSNTCSHSQAVMEATGVFDFSCKPRERMWMEMLSGKMGIIYFWSKLLNAQKPDKNPQ